MTDRSYGQILVRTTEPSVVFGAIDDELRRFRFRRVGPSDALGPTDVAGVRGAETREYVVRPCQGWTALIAEDLESLYATAWNLHRASRVPVVALRAFKYSPWQLKAYGDSDLVVKVGTDPDHELAWVGMPLTPDRVGIAAAALGGGPAITRFCTGAAHGRASLDDLQDAIPGASLRLVFQDAVSAAGRTYVAWTTTRP